MNKQCVYISCEENSDILKISFRFGTMQVESLDTSILSRKTRHYIMVHGLDKLLNHNIHRIDTIDSIHRTIWGLKALEEDLTEYFETRLSKTVHVLSSYLQINVYEALYRFLKMSESELKALKKNLAYRLAEVNYDIECEKAKIN